MPVDYSKFDHIVDSDEEAPAAKEAVTKRAEPEPMKKCGGCGKSQAKLSLCSICKKTGQAAASTQRELREQKPGLDAGYCSAHCQREDWRFHKRVCSQPEEEKKKKAPPAEKKKKTTTTKPAAPVVSTDDASTSEDEKDEAQLSWYKHRETKLPPSAAGPSKIEAPEMEVGLSPAAVKRELSAGSVWNAAGTWEERDALPWARAQLEATLVGLKSDAGTAVVEVTAVSVDGDASVGVNRGKTRHIFDLSLDLSLEARFAGRDVVSKGTLKIADFTHDADEALQCTFKATDKVNNNAPQVQALVLGPAKTNLLELLITSPALDNFPLKTLAHAVIAILRDTFLPAFNAL